MSTSSHRISSDYIRAAARGHWGMILAALAPVLISALMVIGRHVPCPVHGGKDGFRLFRDALETGGGGCNTCGLHRDGFGLLMWLNGWAFPETARAVLDALGGCPDPGIAYMPHRSPKPPPPQYPSSRKRAALQGRWKTSLPLDDPAAHPARRYLKFRVPGLGEERWPQVLRFHPALPYCDREGAVQGHHPALLACVQGPDGRPVTIHRTYLTTHGRKADVEAPKKLMSPSQPGAIQGAAIRLFEATSELALTEGIETALAVHVATGLPVWAALNANGLGQVVIPESCQSIIICGDHDANLVGQNAAYALANRLALEGRTVKVVIPPAVDTDWSDHVAESARHD